MRIILVDPADPREDRLEHAVAEIEAGGVVALPTETLYGLAVDPFNPGAVRRLNLLKGKPEGSPVLLLLSHVSQVSQVADRLPAAFGTLAEAFWPGPLTLVVPAAEALPDEVSGGKGTVGVRVPGLRLPRRLAAALGRPITGVSANLHTLPPCRTATEVVATIPEGIDLLLDGGPTTGGAPSTVLDLTGSAPSVVRPGAIPVTALAPFLPDLEKAPG
jgi:tRNA threonylcarbamoyl adenosine modification protein (Sua5/YciO/YrdC/YwlC family)